MCVCVRAYEYKSLSRISCTHLSPSWLSTSVSQSVTQPASQPVSQSDPIRMRPPIVLRNESAQNEAWPKPQQSQLHGCQELRRDGLLLPACRLELPSKRNRGSASHLPFARRGREMFSRVAAVLSAGTRRGALQRGGKTCLLLLPAWVSWLDIFCLRPYTGGGGAVVRWCGMGHISADDQTRVRKYSLWVGIHTLNASQPRS